MDIKRIWNDPVGSKVIAAVIVGIGTGLWAFIPTYLRGLLVLVVFVVFAATIVVGLPIDKKEDAIIKLKQYWLIWVILLCTTVVFTTWQITMEVVGDHHEQENPLVLEETGVFISNSVTTRDGGCNIRIENVAGDVVTLSVAVDAFKPIVFSSKRVGDRVAVDAVDRVYYVDIHRIRGDIVDLAVYRRRK